MPKVKRSYAEGKDQIIWILYDDLNGIPAMRYYAGPNQWVNHLDNAKRYTVRSAKRVARRILRTPIIELYEAMYECRPIIGYSTSESMWG